MSVSPQKHPASEAPPGPVSAAGGTRITEKLLLLTHDESLIEALRSIVAPDSLTVVSDEAALAGHVMSDQVGVVFIDADGPHRPPGAGRQLIQRLYHQLPDVVLVVAGEGAAQSELAPLVTDGTIYRFVHKPVSAQRVKLFVDAAWRRRGGGSASGVYPALSMPQPPPAAAPSRSFAWPTILAGAVVAGAGAVWLLRSHAPAGANSPAHGATSSAAARERAVAMPGAAREQPPQGEAARLTDAARAIDPTPAANTVPVPPPATAPSSTPPASEARDRDSLAAVILQRIYSVDPVFPEIARQRDLTGFVDLEFTVRADGSVTDVTVLKAQPAGIFEKSAVAAVSQWRYRPIERNGVPVDEHARLRLNFAYQ